MGQEWRKVGCLLNTTKSVRHRVEASKGRRTDCVQNKISTYITNTGLLTEYLWKQRFCPAKNSFKRNARLLTTLPSRTQNPNALNRCRSIAAKHKKQ